MWKRTPEKARRSSSITPTFKKNVAVVCLAKTNLASNYHRSKCALATNFETHVSWPRPKWSCSLRSLTPTRLTGTARVWDELRTLSRHLPTQVAQLSSRSHRHYTHSVSVLCSPQPAKTLLFSPPCLILLHGPRWWEIGTGPEVSSWNEDVLGVHTHMRFIVGKMWIWVTIAIYG